MTQCFLLKRNLSQETSMSITMDEEIKRWTAQRKSALVLEIIRSKTTKSNDEFFGSMKRG